MLILYKFLHYQKYKINPWPSKKEKKKFFSFFWLGLYLGITPSYQISVDVKINVELGHFVICVGGKTFSKIIRRVPRLLESSE